MVQLPLWSALGVNSLALATPTSSAVPEAMLPVLPPRCRTFDVQRSRIRVSAIPSVHAPGDALESALSREMPLPQTSSAPRD